MAFVQVLGPATVGARRFAKAGAPAAMRRRPPTRSKGLQGWCPVDEMQALLRLINALHEATSFLSAIRAHHSSRPEGTVCRSSIATRTSFTA